MSLRKCFSCIHKRSKRVSDKRQATHDDEAYESRDTTTVVACDQTEAGSDELDIWVHRETVPRPKINNVAVSADPCPLDADPDTGFPSVSVKDRIKVFEGSGPRSTPDQPEPVVKMRNEGHKPKKKKPQSKAFEDFETSGIIIGFGNPKKGPRNSCTDEVGTYVTEFEGFPDVTVAQGSTCEDGVGSIASNEGHPLVKGHSQDSDNSISLGSGGKLTEDEGIHTMESDDDDISSAVPRTADLLKSFRRAAPPKNRMKSRRTTQRPSNAQTDGLQEETEHGSTTTKQTSKQIPEKYNPSDTSSRSQVLSSQSELSSRSHVVSTQSELSSRSHVVSTQSELSSWSHSQVQPDFSCSRTPIPPYQSVPSWRTSNQTDSGVQSTPDPRNPAATCDQSSLYPTGFRPIKFISPIDPDPLPGAGRKRPDPRVVKRSHTSPVAAVAPIPRQTSTPRSTDSEPPPGKVSAIRKALSEKLQATTALFKRESLTRNRLSQDVDTIISSSDAHTTWAKSCYSDRSRSGSADSCQSQLGGTYRFYTSNPLLEATYHTPDPSPTDHISPSTTDSRQGSYDPTPPPSGPGNTATKGPRLFGTNCTATDPDLAPSMYHHVIPRMGVGDHYPINLTGKQTYRPPLGLSRPPLGVSRLPRTGNTCQPLLEEPYAHIERRDRTIQDLQPPSNLPAVLRPPPHLASIRAPPPPSLASTRTPVLLRSSSCDEYTPHPSHPHLPLVTPASGLHWVYAPATDQSFELVALPRTQSQSYAQSESYEVSGRAQSQSYAQSESYEVPGRAQSQSYAQSESYEVPGRAAGSLSGPDSVQFSDPDENLAIVKNVPIPQKTSSAAIGSVWASRYYSGYRESVAQRDEGRLKTHQFNNTTLPTPESPTSGPLTGAPATGAPLTGGPLYRRYIRSNSEGTLV